MPELSKIETFRANLKGKHCFPITLEHLIHMLKLKIFIISTLLIAFSLSANGDTRSWLQPVENSLLDDTPWGISAREYDLDPWLLFAISLEETGRYDKARGAITPWPYTTHRNGVVIQHETQEDAIKQINAWEAAGIKNYDVGPFQINRRWHAERFLKIEHMLDVSISAKYVGELLRSAIGRSNGNVLEAVGLLRSWRGGAEAQNYSEQIKIIRSQLPGGLERCCI